MSLTQLQMDVAAHLIVRGVSDNRVALALGVRKSMVAESIGRPVRAGTEVDDYRAECLERALADPYPEEAAEYLYVRSVPLFTIETSGLLKRPASFDPEKRVRYQAKQVELALKRLHA